MRFFHTLSDFFLRIWYQVRPHPVSQCLMPLALLWSMILGWREKLYEKKFLKQTRISKPVIIIGNLTLGGTGKTPLVIALTHFFTQQGFKVGIVSRGYKGKSSQAVRSVFADSDPKICGDEAVLLAQRTPADIRVSKNRVRAAQLLAEQCDIILSDDGLQHTALGRDIEIVVIDGKRRFGNGRVLPAGPLREPLQRLERVNFIVENGGLLRDATYIPMQLVGIYAQSLFNPEKRMDLIELTKQPIHAVAAIGHPERFFTHLRQLGLNIIEHAFTDHHFFERKDFIFEKHPSAMVLMTEKDAVKCRDFKDLNLWYVPVDAMLPQDFYLSLLSKIQSLSS